VRVKHADELTEKAEVAEVDEEAEIEVEVRHLNLHLWVPF